MLNITKGVGSLSIVLSQFLNKIVVAIVILIIGFVVGRVFGKLIAKLLHEIELNRLIAKRGIKISLEEIISNGLTYLIYFISLIMALNHLGLAATVLYFIYAAILVLLIISIFLAIKDFMPNVIAGFVLFQKGTIKKGDTIIVDTVKGKVKHLGLVETEIRTKEGDTIYIPNSLLMKKKLIVKKG